MAKTIHNWLKSSNISLVWAIFAATLWYLIIYYLSTTEIAQEFENKVARSIDFQIRHALKQDPVLDPKIKIFGVDDGTVAWLKSPVLTMQEWAVLLTALDAKKPKTILIDSMFSIPHVPPGQNRVVNAAIEKIASLKTNIVVASFIAPKSLKHRVPVNLDHEDFNLEKLLRINSESELSTRLLARRLRIANGRSSFVYGPYPSIRNAFDHFGHILYDGSGKFAPLIKVQPNRVIPHFTLFAADKYLFSKGNFYVNDKLLPTDQQGTAYINFSPFETYFKRTKPLRVILYKASNDMPIDSVSEGDYVVLVPFMYTGNTDFKRTPFGYMPGAFSQVAVLNSVLTGQWLKPISAQEIIIAVACAAGAAIGSINSSLIFIAGFLLALLFWSGLSICLFAYLGIVIDWFFPISGFVMTSLSVFIRKVQMVEKKSRLLRSALEGSIPSRRLTSLIRNPQQINLEARERVVSIMFIDVVGFSLTVEDQLPKLAFERLKNLFNQLSYVVHEFGGTINKTLGDGLLCYFGYCIESDLSTPDHADRALECAVKIQKENLTRNIRAQETDEPVYPLRIGINTASVFLGDIGTQNRMDFTVVGNGVNFAKRLEGACEMHSILLSKTTKELITSSLMQTAGLKKRVVSIKHHNELVEAIEYDPFFANPDLRKVAVDAFRKSASLARKEQRWTVSVPQSVTVHTNVGKGYLVNFSHTGFSVSLPTLLVKGSELRMRLESTDDTFNSQINEAKLQDITGDVRWGYSDEKRFIHGIQFKNLSAQKCNDLVELLKNYDLAVRVKKHGKTLNAS